MAGLLINGQWKTKNEFADKDDGKFKCDDSKFRNFIGKDGFDAESNRYHLYVSLACPWAHRTLIFRHLKNLETHIDVSVVHPHMLDNGWEFGQDFSATTGDKLYNLDYLYELYTKAKSDYSGKLTVPVLWDKKREIIVSNESADIIRIFNTEFNKFTGNTDDYYPEHLREQIDILNDRIYNTINNGVYKAGFATNQKVYDEAVKPLFETLEWIERELSDGRSYLLGEKITEADIRLLTTLLRFDAVYYTHFKCNDMHIEDYKFIQDYMVRLYKHDAVYPTVNMNHIKHHYYRSHPTVNPSGIIATGPNLLWL